MAPSPAQPLPTRQRPRKGSKASPHKLSARLTYWEEATNVEEATLPGILPRTALFPLTLLAAVLIMVLWGPVLGFWGAFIAALVLGRLLALDATTYTLPHIYTVPLVLVGWAHAGANGRLLMAWVAVFILGAVDWVLTRTKWRAGVGGGDIRLLMAMFAFLPTQNACFAITLGCFIWLPFVLKNPKNMVPLGVPLIVGWVLWVRFSPLLLGAVSGSF